MRGKKDMKQIFDDFGETIILGLLGLVFIGVFVGILLMVS